MLTIDGLTPAAPSELHIGYESIGRAEITADGSTVADRLALKRTALLVWRGLGRDDAAQLLTVLTQGVFLAVTLPDPRTGDAASLTMRLTRLETELQRVDPGGRPETCRTITAALRER